MSTIGGKSFVNITCDQTSLIMHISNSRITNRAREPNFGTQRVLWDRNFFVNITCDQTSLIMRISNSRPTNRVREPNFGMQRVVQERNFLSI